MRGIGVIAFVEWNRILRFVAANPGFIVVADLGHHTKWSVLMERV